MNLIRRASNPLSTFRPGAVEDPFGRMVESMVESMFQDFFSPLAQGSRWSDDGLGMPRLDVRKDDIKVAIDGPRVSIEGKCQQANEQREGEQVVYSERSTRRYQRSFSLPSEVDDATAEARLEDGVLKLTLPKKAGGSARRLTIR
jgi:HSP20 family protein